MSERKIMRYDGYKYRDCKWCSGSGCLYCQKEADKAYNSAFPNGPQPIAAFDISTEKGADEAMKSIGAEALKKAFGSGGGGISEILENIKKAQISE